MNKLNIYFLLLIGLISCSTKSVLIGSAEYINARNQFDTSLVSHFPSNLPHNQIGFGFSTPDVGSYSGFHLHTKLKSINEYYNILNLYSQYSLKTFKSCDTCIIIINTDENSENIDTNTKECESYLPVPKYLLYGFKNFDQKNHQADLEITIINTLPGSYLEREKDPLCYLPKLWQHGLAKGFAFNKSELVLTYWLIIW